MVMGSLILPSRVTNTDIEAVILNSDLKQLMNPLFEEAKLGTIDLGQDEFIEACKDLIRNSQMPQRFTLINQYLATRRNQGYEGHQSGGGKPSINPVSSMLSYKDSYANHNVFDRLIRGRENVVKATRLEKRLKRSQQSLRDSQRDSEGGSDVDPDSNYKIRTDEKHHAFEENVVREEDEEEEYN